eukprot:NODE_25131_length_598_cov_1.908705.p3 GENE.NODE_25131_length_598_cov_1.908705~~NODE_25131_length_598_cov_1.908705.p3  ORF type:complete len:99 (-),score=59.52 NODE_25131_length_598_cov_1.908705:81-377(-)
MRMHCSINHHQPMDDQAMDEQRQRVPRLVSPRKEDDQPDLRRLQGLRIMSQKKKKKKKKNSALIPVSYTNLTLPTKKKGKKKKKNTTKKKKKKKNKKI